jgi:hypothetical protein
MPPALDETNKRWKARVDSAPRRRVRLQPDQIGQVQFSFWKRVDEDEIVSCPTPNGGRDTSSDRGVSAILCGPADDWGAYACVVTTQRCGTAEEGKRRPGTRHDPPLRVPIMNLFGPRTVRRHSTRLIPPP